MQRYQSRRLVDTAPELARLLTRDEPGQALCSGQDVRIVTQMVSMRDGVRLATDLYLPPRLPAPTIAMRTPYGRASEKIKDALLTFARHGYVVASQDCRGTGDSEPDSWDYYMYETEDSYDFVQWITQQSWYGEFIGACGGSYVGQTQWCMAVHPRMSTIVPEVSGLGVASHTAHVYMIINAYARSVGKGEGNVSIPYSELERSTVRETLAGGYFNDPLHPPFSEDLHARYSELRSMPPSQARRWLWEQYCGMDSQQRAAFVKAALGTRRVSVLEVECLSSIFGQHVAHDAHTIPHTEASELCRLVNAPPLMITGWYDWCLNDALATWALLKREARQPLASRSRLIIAPNAHNVPGYHEGAETHPELQHNHRTPNQVGLLLRWYAAVREGTTDHWPNVIYYLMGANEWCVSSDWPPSEARTTALYLGPQGTLISQPPSERSEPDTYVYDPQDPTPTVGGSIISYVYPPGSVDVSAVQRRDDVLSYTTAVFEHDFDVVGPLRLVLYVSSSARDTDFSARVSDVFPDGRAIQLQSGLLRARYRNSAAEPEFMEPGHIYCLEIDLWATANRFRAGHRLRLDISSADFPRFDRNTNRGGDPGEPVRALQTIHHDPEHPSHLLVCALAGSSSQSRS
jgi:predicted acyl esterase